MKGDTKVIDYLNRAIRSELTAVSQYWLHYRLQEDWGFGKIAAKSRAESIEEMHHADKLIARIIFLEGHPNLQKLDPLRIGQDLRETLEADSALKTRLEAIRLQLGRFKLTDVKEQDLLAFDGLVLCRAEIDEAGDLLMSVHAEGCVDVAVIGGVFRDPDACPTHRLPLLNFLCYAVDVFLTRCKPRITHCVIE